MFHALMLYDGSKDASRGAYLDLGACVTCHLSRQNTLLSSTRHSVVLRSHWLRRSNNFLCSRPLTCTSDRLCSPSKHRDHGVQHCGLRRQVSLPQLPYPSSKPKLTYSCHQRFLKRYLRLPRRLPHIYRPPCHSRPHLQTSPGDDEQRHG